MINRKIDKEFDNFHVQGRKEALLIDGARQVGKTFSVREYGKRHFKQVVEVNFLKDRSAKSLFDDVHDAKEVLTRLSAYWKGQMVPGETLIFFDEVQECPEVVTYIKFLVDEGNYRYVLSGSLLGVELKDIRSAPVGYLREITMYPLDFEEFTSALGMNDDIRSHLKESWGKVLPVDPFVHDRIKTLFRLYLVVGGMPAAVQTYLDTENIGEVVKVQKAILVEYRKDAAKYDRKHKLDIVRTLDLIPEELNDKNKRFLIADLKDRSRYDRLKANFLWLKESGIGLVCTSVDDPKVPLKLTQDSSFFKLFMNDVGLLSAMYMDNVQYRILSGEIDVNNGSIYENFVAQELHAHGFELHYFQAKDVGEIDFLVVKDGKVLPIEAKSGRHYRVHAALDKLLAHEGYGIRRAIVLSSGNAHHEASIDYLPVYMVMFLAHDGLPSDLTFPRPSLDLKVSPPFRNRSKGAAKPRRAHHLGSLGRLSAGLCAGGKYAIITNEVS